MSRFVGFIGPSYQLSSVNVDCQRCVNLYPEIDEIGTGKEKEVAALLGTPGLRLLATVGAGPIRGMWNATNGQGFYVVSYNKLYKVSSLWVATELGTLSSTDGPVSIADNGLQLVVVDGPNGYIWDFALLTFNQVTDPAFPGADQVVFQDSYFVFTKPSSGMFFISGQNEVTFDALDIASAEGSPDNLNGILSSHRDLWLFGTQSVEVWFDSGAALFPFERIQGAFVEQGCAAKFSVAKMDNTVFWLGQNEKGGGIVFMANGYQPMRISTHAVEQAIQSYGDLSATTGYTYQSGGHHFYVLNFAAANTTWVFDTSTKLWHERTYTVAGQAQRHRADNHAYAFSTHVVGDYQNGNIYELTKDVFTDNGSAIIRRRVTPHLSEDEVFLFFNEFQLDIESGTGLDGSGQGTDPQAILEWSDDFGHTWSNEKWASMGKIGQTKWRAMWRRMGRARDRVFRVTISDPVKVVLIGAEIDFTPGGR